MLKKLTTAPALIASTTLCWPIGRSTTAKFADRIDKPFGFRTLCPTCGTDFHRGIDFDYAYNTPVHAVFNGTVVRIRDVDPTSSDPLPRYGKFIVISLDPILGRDGRAITNHQVAYLHLSHVESSLKLGSVVTTGQLLGRIGNSGVGINTTHLHFEYYQGLSNGTIERENARNPLEILPYHPSAPTVTLVKLSQTILRLAVRQPHTSLDIVGYRIEHNGSSSYHGSNPIEIDFNEKTGINMLSPDFEDKNPFQGTTFRPTYFNSDDQDYELVMDFDGTWNAADTFVVTLKTVHDQEYQYSFILPAIP